MVSKSYEVNECPTLTDDDHKSVKNAKLKADNDQMSKIDRYILHISNEMVKMKPSNIFNDDNSSTRYWSKNSIIRWSKECTDGRLLSPKMLIRLVVFTVLFIGFSYLLISWIQPRPSPTIRSMIDSSLTRNLSFTNSTMTEEPSWQKTSTQPSTNVISRDDEHVEKSNGDVLLTKKYVERINFYTTSNKQIFSVKVSPTLPTIIFKHDPTTELPIQSYANDNNCQSTSLPLCQGVLSYDLTDPRAKWNLTNVEYQHFQHLLASDCSKRVAEFACHMLEPECRPTRMKTLKPCRRICKGIFESCSHIIASSEVLTAFFDCNTYIDSSDHSMCEDITRISKKCFDDEFQCADSSCIPNRWRCDNIRDCPTGEDERDCKFCNYDEFKCVSDKKCISDKWYCDGVDDCVDGSDEADCDIESGEDDERTILYLEDKDYAQSSSEQDHNDADGDRIVSTGDGIVPIFINPNASSASPPPPPTTTKVPRRFRSTMRKAAATTQKPPEGTTTMKHKNEIVKASTSHSSPCPEFELRCVDGLCITLDQICDKIQDCSDNSDELHCDYER